MYFCDKIDNELDLWIFCRFVCGDTQKIKKEDDERFFRFMGFGYRNMTQDAAQAFRVE
jgi:hypothetical protein